MKKVLAIFLVFILSLVTIGCSSGNPAANETSGGAKYSQGASDTEIVIGSTLATSGAYAVIGLPATAGIKAYLDMVNEDGGIDGRKITFTHADDEGDPVKAKAAMQQLVEEEKVFSVVAGSSVTPAVLDDLKDYGIPAVYHPSGIRELYAEQARTNEEGYNIFPVQPIYLTEGQIMAARAIGDLNAEKIGMIYVNDDSCKDMHEGAEKIAGESGVSFKGVQISATDTDVSASVATIKDYDPDVILIGAVTDSFAMIIKEMIAQGIAVPVITTYANASKVVPELIYADVDGKFDIFCSDWGNFGNEVAFAQFAQWISHYDESYATNSYALAGWLAAYTFCEGLYRLEGQDITWENYMKALESQPIESPFGIVLDYANGQRIGVGKMLFKIMDMNAADESNWSVIADFASLEEILEGR